MGQSADQNGKSKAQVLVPCDQVSRLLGAVASRDINGGVFKNNSFVAHDLGRSRMNRCQFQNCDFSDMAATGVVWRDNDFIDCLFNRADVEFADLWGCKFMVQAHRGTPIIAGAGFNGVILRDATLDGVFSVASSFADADFTGAKVRQCSLGGTFEGSLFHGTVIESTDFLNSNVAYADFSGAHFDDVSFDLSSFPYLLGIDLDELDHGVKLFACGEGNDGTASARIGAAGLGAIAPRLIDHYVSRQDYFAAANLSFICGKMNEIMPLFLDGIRAAWLAKNLREIKLICKLARHMEDRQGLFGVSSLRKLYDLITASVAQSGEVSLQNQYALHDGQIRAYLLTSRPGVVQLQFQSRTTLPTEANEVTTKVIAAVQEIGMAAGILLEVTGAHFTVNSYPRHVIEVRVAHEPEPASKAPSPWLTFFVATMAMVFTGFNAVRPLFAEQPVTPVIQQIIVDQHQQIGPVIVPQTMVITKDGLPLTGWEGERLVLFTPTGAPILGR